MFKKFVNLMGGYYNEQEYFTARFKTKDLVRGGKWAQIKEALKRVYDELDYFYTDRTKILQKEGVLEKKHKNIA